MRSELNDMRVRSLSSDGYDGVTHAGIALVSADGLFVLLAQRTFDETDEPEVRETWEFPGGALEDGEEPYAAAVREFGEEIGLPYPADADVFNGWRSSTKVYQGFVTRTTEPFDLTAFTPTEEVQAVRWASIIDVMALGSSGQLRPEMAETDWPMIFGVSGNEDEMTEAPINPPGADSPDEADDDSVHYASACVPIAVHGVLAPEDTESGDKRGFNAGAMTARPLRLPFSWQKMSSEGHDNSMVVGSVDRLMRKDGLIHWEGALMCSRDANDFAELLAFMGAFGVSVDGDKGSLDTEKSHATGMVWFDAVRAAGLTAVAIPAFAEAYVAFGPHPDMPVDQTEEAVAMTASGSLVGLSPFKRGPGWVTDPVATNRIHDYWTKKGEPGYAKIAWGTPGDFARAKALIGAKIAEHSPDTLRFLNAIIAQWHFDALGYWPATHAKMVRGGTKAATDTVSYDLGEANRDIEATDGGGWEAVLTSSAGARVCPPPSYFSRHEDTDALVIEEPDENGLRRTYGYAGEWGVCHVGFDGRCVEVPDDSGEFVEFHLGRTKTTEGYINTGLITYKVDHREAKQILSETAERQHYDNIAHAWAAVRLGVDDRGIWFSGVVLPSIPEEDLVLIEAAGQVSGEWKYGALRALQAVNVPGFPVMRSSAAYDDEGNVLALVASAMGGECQPSPKERMQALAQVDAEVRFAALKEKWRTEHGL